MIKNCTAFSNKENQSEAFDEVKRKIESMGKPMLIIFASQPEGFDFFTLKFHINFKDAVVVGATTFLAYTNGGYGENCLAALAVYEGIECSAGAIFEITRYPLRYAGVVEETLKKLHGYENTICIQYSTAYGKSEELVQDTYRSVLEHRHIEVLGGTAGAKSVSDRTFVSLNGTVFEDASVFVFIKNLGGRILTYKENIFKPTNHYFSATDADCDERKVYEFDGKPAAEFMAMLLDMSPRDLKNDLDQHPIGRLSKDDIYITAADSINDDGSISYYARVYNRTKLVLLELDDVERVWNETAANISYDIDNPSMSIIVNCNVRALLYKRSGLEDKFYKKLAEEYGNHIGIIGFGEQVHYEHFNATMVMAVFE